MKLHQEKLANGLRVIIVPIKEVQSATTLVMVGAGSRYENRKNSGVSHFLEHMAFKGTTKRPTAMEIATIIDEIGADSNAFTSKEYTGYYIRSSADHVALSLDLLSDLLINPLLNKEEIDRERGVIIGEIDLYEDTPSRKIGDIFELLLYGDTSMGWDVAGEKDIIRTIERREFVSYMKRFYNASNMVVVIAGNVEIKKSVEMINKAFSMLPKRKSETFSKVKESQKNLEVMLKHKKTEQAHFALGVRTVGLLEETDRYPLTILASLLGGGMSSRLFNEVREKRGLGYYVRAYSEHYVDCGYLAAFSGVDPKKIDEAIKVIADEYEKVKKPGELTKKEVEKAKEYVKGHFILGLEDTKSVAGYFATDELLMGRVESPEEVIEKIEGVNEDQVLTVAKKYLKPDFYNLAIIGNFENSERFKKLLK